MSVNLEEYKKFLEEKGHFEERNALGVLDVIVRHHTFNNSFELTFNSSKVLLELKVHGVAITQRPTFNSSKVLLEHITMLPRL